MLFNRRLIMLIVLLSLTGCNALDTWFLEDNTAPTQAVIIGDPVRGEQLFKVGINDTPPCSTCHQIGASTGFSLAPNLAGIVERASQHAPDLTPEDYIHQSIVDPEAIVISGYRVSMYTQYAEHLSEQDIADIIAYLLSN